MDPSLLNAFGPWGALAAVLIYLFARKPSPPAPSPVAPDPVKPEPDPDTPMLDMLKEILKLLLGKGDVIPMSGGAKPQVIESASGPHLLIPLEGGGYQLDPLPHNPPDVRY